MLVPDAVSNVALREIVDGGEQRSEVAKVADDRREYLHQFAALISEITSEQATSVGGFSEETLVEDGRSLRSSRDYQREAVLYQINLKRRHHELRAVRS